MLGYGLGGSDHGDRCLFSFWSYSFALKKTNFRFRLLATAELIGDYFYNRQLKASMFLLVITAPIYSIGASKFFHEKVMWGKPTKNPQNLNN